MTAALVATAQPAHAAVDDWTIPDKATIRIYGHGYGHGHGMSQHGAQGAALQGLTHQEIVAFYYPGTTPGTAKGKVSVLISADTSKDVQVLAEPGLQAARARQRQGARPGQGPAAGDALEGHPGQRRPGRGVLPHRGLEDVPHRRPATPSSSAPVPRRRWCCRPAPRSPTAASFAR